MRSAAARSRSRVRAYLVFERLFFGENRTNAPQIEVVAARWPRPSWLTTDEALEDDANPVAVLWDLWTHPRYGLGLPEGRLDVAHHITLVADTFEVLSEELFKVTPTYQNRAPNTVIGPPTSGERVLRVLWKDSLGGWWKCTAAGTLGIVDGEIGGLMISDPPTQAEVQALRDKCEDLADDVRKLSTLIHSFRVALVAVGLVKGAA